ncbi:tubulin polyglutamylase ttll-4-like [Hetaerina americana]|uniref:tubulin polyglutamylase ttll-4-like n=1 Tax=Hetaerina americana TaxID=62018 RepID=UPI003A7F149A
MRAARVGAVSIRDLLVIATTFSLLSLFLTYHLGFHATRLRLNAAAEAEVAVVGPARDASLPLGDLRLILKKLEEEQLERRSGAMEVKLHGQLSTLRRDLPLYSRALRRAGFRSQSNISILQKNGNITRSSDGIDTEAWCLFLCMMPLESDEDSCLNEVIPLSLIPSQKIGRIPGIRRALWSRDGLCLTRVRLRSLLEPLRPKPCYVLPGQYEDLLTAADGPRFNTSWVLKPLAGRPDLLTTMEFFSRVRRKEFSESFEGIVEEYIPNQLRIFGYPVSVQCYLLITSLEPLRVYVYSEGLVFFRQEKEKGYRKILSKSWFLSQLWRHLSKTSSPVRLAIERTDEALVHILLAAQDAAKGFVERTSSTAQGKRRFRCWNCFQLLAVELVYNTSLHPEVLEFDGQPSMRESWRGEAVGSGARPPWHHASNAMSSLKAAVLLEMLKILFASNRVHEDTLAALQSAAEDMNIGIAGGNCKAWHTICLSMDDLRFILDTQRESMHLNDFRRIYPTSNSERYSNLISDLQILPADDYSRNARQYLTPKLHVLLSRLEATFRAQEVPEYEYSYLTETRLNSTRSVNTTLGVGANRLPVHVVDAIGSVINTYVLTIRRKNASEGEEPLNTTLRHTVCSLRQKYSHSKAFNSGADLCS